MNLASTLQQVDVRNEDVLNPAEIASFIRNLFGDIIENVLVLGDFTDRTIVIDFLIDGIRTQVSWSLNRILEETGLFQKYGQESLRIQDPKQQVSISNIKPEALELLGKPEILMVALYHPENFPLPRFPLGISDIAGAVRRNYVGQISLADMQLGVDIEGVLEMIKKQRPDILGVSVTFGQQDKLEVLLDGVEALEGKKPWIVVGGSLATLNAEHLLQKHPQLIVGRGYGETTMQDVTEFWHGIRELGDVNDISYSEEGDVKRTPKRKNDKLSKSTPELDLLPRTLELRGVMQMESSRGCTYACSFCPRGHKGIWFDQAGDSFRSLLPMLDRVFAKFPGTARKIFLVDEEFVGYEGQNISLERGKTVAETLHEYGFEFESSTRIDQVYRPNKPKEWHEERFEFWRYLANNGLSRMLFGMESGVASILKRFNKKTTPEQNVKAVRALSTCGVPMRLSCITFDPLMTMDELKENYEYQGRTDVLLRKNDELTEGEIHDVISDPEYVAANSLGEPLYKEIPYMLVSMECLLGSQYLQMVEDEGLARDVSLSMGRRHAEYQDPRISLMSKFSQLWIDRNFALDYLLKSIVKVSNCRVGEVVKQLRIVIKDFAYNLLGKMLAQAEVGDGALTEASLKALIDEHFSQLVDQFETDFATIKSDIPESDLMMIETEISRWKSMTEWETINN